jgi:hypothetical protein
MEQLFRSGKLGSFGMRNHEGEERECKCLSLAISEEGKKTALREPEVEGGVFAS